jgi:hypothetical protein
MAVSCFNFIEDMQNVLEEQGRDIAQHNRRERIRFKNPR